MADLIITMKIMPESPEVDLGAIKTKAMEIISQFECRGTQTEEEPIAFGLKAIILKFAYPEEKGSTDEMEAKLAEIEGVNSAEVTGLDRALG